MPGPPPAELLAARIPSYTPGIGVDGGRIALWSVVLTAAVIWTVVAMFRRDGSGYVSFVVAGAAATAVTTSAIWTTPESYVMPSGSRVTSWQDADLAAVARGQVIRDIEQRWGVQVLTPDRVPTMLGPGGDYEPVEREFFLLAADPNGQRQWCSVTTALISPGELAPAVMCEDTGPQADAAQYPPP